VPAHEPPLRSVNGARRESPILEAIAATSQRITLQELIMLKFLIPVDGSAHAKHAMDAVAKLVRSSTQLEVTLLNVRDGPVYYGELSPITIEQIEQIQKQQQDEILADAERHGRSLELKITSVQRASGFAPAEIVRVAGECGADQIAMGTRGLGAMGSLFLGSVAQRVVRDAKVPVLLVK
jgi:nucleotide-binding universal stress UspA family protein